MSLLLIGMAAQYTQRSAHFEEITIRQMKLEKKIDFGSECFFSV
jgi:hypothetical protein